MKYSVEQLLNNGKDYTKEDFIFFWGHHKTNGINKGCFSQWWPCDFKVNGIKYIFAEQYMMAGKARLFNDQESLQKILEAKEPNICKYLGRQVKNFNLKIWNKNCCQIVIEGNFAKFSQNEYLKQQLLSTENKILVEASPYDHIWGIKMSKDDPDCISPNKWKGTNFLGFALMEVRDLLREGQIEPVCGLNHLLPKN